MVLGLALTGCAKKSAAPTYVGTDLPPDVAGNTSPSGSTAALNAAVRERLPLGDRQDFEDAKPEGTLIWDMPSYAFVEGDAPPSANPSLWRQAKLNNIHGLFEVTKGVYQLRGYDLANMSLIEGESGWIVVDPLTAGETSAKALAFAREHLGDKPVSAIIFTHSHVDHFGGVLGIVSPEEVEQRQVPIIAPEGFVDEATSENIVAGVAMSRRSLFMFGPRLPHGERGHIGSGLGKGPAIGTIGILAPTQTISKTTTELTIDGVKFIFQNAPGSEAPAELTFYLPDLKTFCGAEVVSHNMHNLYTLRGAKVRDALKWSGYIDEVIQIFGDAEVYFGSHHWPIWGNERIGWYDGNPANLDPLPPVQAGVRYVKLAGGAANLLQNAQAAYDSGEYRWVAQVVNHLVFADPDNQDARSLLARAYDQLGYQAESGPWRDVYLTGAFELRHGGPDKGINLASAMGMIKHAPLVRFLDAMAARLNATKAEGKEMVVNLVITDIDETHVLELKNSVLRHYEREADPDANVTLKVTHDLYLRMLTGTAGLKDTLFSDELSVEGSRLDLIGFLGRSISSPPEVLVEHADFRVCFQQLRHFRRQIVLSLAKLSAKR
ncbi:MAG: MBL fold metallo-hydrolase [Deltaproteobacteria bacterium]|nr:MBL fold metallo-hydrolase [Deltaproteobacteria bacterium]